MARLKLVALELILVAAGLVGFTRLALLPHQKELPSGPLPIPRRSLIAGQVHPHPITRSPPPPVRAFRPDPSAFNSSGLRNSAEIWHKLQADRAYNIRCGYAQLSVKLLDAIAHIWDQPHNITRVQALESLVAEYTTWATNTTWSGSALRRLTMATMYMAQELAGSRWSAAHQQVHENIALLWFQRHHGAALTKGNVELTHISKCGGTSMCQLAMKNGCKNPDPSTLGNCLISKLNDGPLWTVPTYFYHNEHSVTLRPFCVYSCASWLKYPERNCKYRGIFLRYLKTNFYSNERALRGGNGSPGSSATCQEFFNLIVLRDPLHHVQSLLLNVHHNTQEYIPLRHQQPWMADFKLPPELSLWEKMSPAVVNNYYTRTLLGRHAYCEALGNITSADGLHATAKLLQYDAVLDLDDPLPSRDNMLRLGMGWSHTLADLHVRPTPAQQPPLQQMGISEEQALPRLKELNSVDEEVYAQARVMAAVDGAWLAEVEQLLGAERSRQAGAAGAAAAAAAKSGGGASSSLLGSADGAGQQEGSGTQGDAQAAGAVEATLPEQAGGTGNGSQGPAAAAEVPIQPALLLQQRQADYKEVAQRQAAGVQQHQMRLLPLLQSRLLHQVQVITRRLLSAGGSEQQQQHESTTDQGQLLASQDPAQAAAAASPGQLLARQILAELSSSGNTSRCGYFSESWVAKQEVRPPAAEAADAGA